MNDAVRQKLLEIVTRHGRKVIENPRRLEGLLRDYCGEFRREVAVLMMAVEEHTVLDLLAGGSGVPQKIFLSRLAQRLSDNLAISETAARWSIESWALALGLVSPEEIISEPEIQKSVLAQASNGISSTITKAASSNLNLPANVFIVSPNRDGDFMSIGEALRNVTPNSRLLVREGIYHETIIINQSVEILGDGEIEKIVVRGTDSSPIAMQTEKALIRGLTLEGRGSQSGKAFFTVQIPTGKLILENCHITSDSLSGVAIFGENTYPEIKNCRIYNCADSGIYFFDQAQGLIENCDIFRNTNVGVALTLGSRPTLKNCRIFEGQNGGVVSWGDGTKGLIEDCEIYGHRLANIGVREFANPIFRRCKIHGGHDTGVFVHQNGDGIFEECNIYRNTRAEVGISESGQAIFRRSSIHNGESSGLIVQNKGRALIENCNIYDNSDAGIEVKSESAVVVRNSNINRNQQVALKIMEQSSATVENCDLRGNLLGSWETEPGVILNENGNRED